MISSIFSILSDLDFRDYFYTFSFSIQTRIFPRPGIFQNLNPLIQRIFTMKILSRFENDRNNPYGPRTAYTPFTLACNQTKKKNLKLLAQHHQSPWELFSGPVPGSLQNNFTSTYMKLILTYQSLPLRIPKLLTYVTSFTLLGFAGNSRTNFGDIYQLSCTNPFPHTHNLFNNSIIKWEVASVKHSHFPQSKIVHLPSPLIVLSINSPANTQQTTRV